MTFDSLTFATRLKAAGFSDARVETLAGANRDPVVHDLATKDDIGPLKGDLTILE